MASAQQAGPSAQPQRSRASAPGLDPVPFPRVTTSPTSPGVPTPPRATSLASRSPAREPELIDESVERDGLASPEQERDEHALLHNPSERDLLPACVEHFERAEDAVLHRLPSPGSIADRSTANQLQQRCIRDLAAQPPALACQSSTRCGDRARPRHPRAATACPSVGTPD